jgi:hypothetical protein
MGAFDRGYAGNLHGWWLQVGITLCSAWAFTLFGKTSPRQMFPSLLLLLLLLVDSTIDDVDKATTKAS